MALLAVLAVRQTSVHCCHSVYPAGAAVPRYSPGGKQEALQLRHCHRGHEPLLSEDDTHTAVGLLTGAVTDSDSRAVTKH